MTEKLEEIARQARDEKVEAATADNQMLEALQAAFRGIFPELEGDSGFVWFELVKLPDGRQVVEFGPGFNVVSFTVESEKIFTERLTSRPEEPVSEAELARIVGSFMGVTFGHGDQARRTNHEQCRRALDPAGAVVT